MANGSSLVSIPSGLQEEDMCSGHPTMHFFSDETIDWFQKSPNGWLSVVRPQGHLVTNEKARWKSGAKSYGICNFPSFVVGMPPILPSWHVTLMPCCIVLEQPVERTCYRDYFWMRVVIMLAYHWLAFTRAYAILAQDILRDTVDTISQNVPQLKLKCSSCGSPPPPIAIPNFMKKYSKR